MKLTTEVMELIEGTWSFPNSDKLIDKLKKVLAKPLRADKAGDVMYDIYGDDALYDYFDELIDDGEGDSDVRDEIKSNLKKAVSDWEKGKTDIKDMNGDLAKKLKAVLK
jgi:hypothetical protein